MRIATYTRISTDEVNHGNVKSIWPHRAHHIWPHPVGAATSNLMG